MRYYFIEATGPPQDRYKADEIIKFLQDARDAYVKRMTRSSATSSPRTGRQ